MPNTITAPTPAADDRAVPQTLRALKLANTRRVAVSELKGRVRRHELTITELVLNPPDDLHGYLLFEVLLWAPRFGRDRLRALNARAIRRCELNLASPVGALTPRQRRWLADQLAGR